jgi:hypothetical protein
MNLQLNKDNFNQTLNRFTTSELETLVEKFPYFQQAHLLLAKKYQQQNDARFDQQLQLAALYTNDRELLYAVFNERTVTQHVPTVKLVEEIGGQDLPDELVSDNQPVIEEQEAKKDYTAPVIEVLPVEKEPLLEEVEVITKPATDEPLAEATLTSNETESLVERPKEETVAEFSETEPHTFDEWLKVYSQPLTLKTDIKDEEIPVEVEKQDEELEKLYVANIPVNLQELVEEETNYSKGLDKFIEEQKQKHKAPAHKLEVYDTELAPEFITETMAKVYESQKKYSKAIKCYEMLGLKYPEKNDFFAARINYLKNIV